MEVKWIENAKNAHCVEVGVEVKGRKCENAKNAKSSKWHLSLICRMRGKLLLFFAEENTGFL